MDDKQKDVERMKAYARFARRHPRKNPFVPTPESDWEEFLRQYTGPKDLFGED